MEQDVLENCNGKTTSNRNSFDIVSTDNSSTQSDNLNLGDASKNDYARPIGIRKPSQRLIYTYSKE